MPHTPQVLESRPDTASRTFPGGAGSLRRRLASPSVFLLVILTAQLMVVLDATIVNVALPHIEEGLHFSGSGLSWVLNAYLLTFGGFLLLGARSGDLIGRRRTFLAGIAIFSASSLLGGFAVTGSMLLAARAAQGVGAALAAPSALALLTTVFSEGSQRVRAIGLFTTVSAAGGAIGLVAGGILTELASWRWVMFVNVPIGLAVWSIGRVVLQETESRHGHFDLAGAITSTLGMASVVLGLVEAGADGWTSPVTLGALGAGLILLALVRPDRDARRRADPPPSPLRQRDAHHRQRVPWVDVRRHVRDVLLPRAVPPRRRGLLAAAGRHLLPPDTDLGVRVIPARQQGPDQPDPPEGADAVGPRRWRSSPSPCRPSCTPAPATARSLSAWSCSDSGSGTSLVSLTSASLAGVEPARRRRGVGVWSTSCSRSGRRLGLAVLVTVLDATAGHSQLGAGVGAAASLVHGLDVTFAVAALFALAALVMVATLVKLPALEPRTTVCAEAEGLEVGLVDGEGFEWADPELVA